MLVFWLSGGAALSVDARLVLLSIADVAGLMPEHEQDRTLALQNIVRLLKLESSLPWTIQIGNQYEIQQHRTIWDRGGLHRSMVIGCDSAAESGSISCFIDLIAPWTFIWPPVQHYANSSSS